MKSPPSEPMDDAAHTKDFWFEEDTEYIGCGPQKQTCTTTYSAANIYGEKIFSAETCTGPVGHASNQICKKERVNSGN